MTADERASGISGSSLHIGDVRRTVHIERVDLRVEGLADLARGARKIDEQTAGIDRIYAKTMRLKPAGDGGKILRGQTVLLPEFGSGQPMVKIRRLGIVQIIQQRVEGRLLLR